MKFETLFEMQILEAKFIRDICKYLFIYSKDLSNLWPWMLLRRNTILSD